MKDLAIGDGVRQDPEAGETGCDPETLRTERDVEAAYGRYGGELLGFAVNALADRELAEEVLQETFIGAWRSADQFDPSRASLRTWLFAIARNRVVDAVRRRKVRAGGIDVERVASSDQSADPIDHLLINIQVSEALRRLTPEHREVVVEVYYLGRTCADLADEKGIPAATMRSRLYYGMRALRLILEQNGWLAQ